jgi:hypothetical protein
MRTALVAPPTSWPTPGAQGCAVTLELSALTPIFKGGSSTAQIDVGRPFRAPSIRGALRYWWRATSSLRSVSDLREREGRVFGGVFDGPVASAVSVDVLRQTSTPGPRPANKPYAFGVTGRPAVGDVAGRQVHLGATGTLRLAWRDASYSVELEGALRAWLLLGGVGSRSRRAAGSVWWDGTGIQAPKTVVDYVAMVSALVPQRTDAPWPTLFGGTLLVGPAYRDADAAWTEGLDGMRDVRASQGVRPSFVARREPHLNVWKNEDYVHLHGHGPFRSARAALGLPVRFMGTMGIFGMSPYGFNRYPSPVHMKVIRLSDGYHPVYIALRGPMPDRLEMHGSQAHGSVNPKGLARFLELARQLPGWTSHPIGGGVP